MKETAVAPPAVLPLTGGWHLCLSDPGAWADPDAISGAQWLPAFVPGTAAQALAAAGRWSLDRPEPLHDRDIWYRTSIAGHGRCTLVFEGLATVAEVFLDGTPILASTSMFERHEVAVALSGEHELAIAFRSLDRHLDGVSGPRARWRTRMIPDQRLRFVRTTLLGHMPGWCPQVHAVGPWRAVLLAQEGALRAATTRMRADLDGEDGVLSLDIVLAGAVPEGPATLACAGAVATLERGGGGRFAARLRVPKVERWWPHALGTPHLHAVTARIGDVTLDLGRVGFRTLALDRGTDGKGFGLRVNGVPLFCGGACWTTPDIVGLPGTREAYRRDLEQVRAANVAMLRVGGTMAYEARPFHELCDELGILVWQEAMFANFDYPAADPAFMAAVEREMASLFDTIGASPSLAVLCGGSEVFQQAAMMGLPAARRAMPLFEEALPAIVASRRPDAIYVPSSPSGGAMPFVVDEGVGHYYGVGAYGRPLEDARRATVRFAAECLAFANVPDEAAVEALGAAAVHDPRWKERVPRDAGASWDFEDVRETYMAMLWGVDPPRLRREAPARYLDFSRAVCAEAMERTLDEWRRPGSSCAGALVFLWKDLWPGAGWGVVDAGGRPKSAFHALRRAFAPLRLIISDEGVNGLVVHAVNAGPDGVTGTLVLDCLGEGPAPVVSGRRAVTLGAHDGESIPVFEMVGAFFDAGYAYRFGPPAHAVVTARLERDGEVVAEAFHLLPQARQGRHAGGMVAEVEPSGDGFSLQLSTERTALFVRIVDAAFEPEDNGFHLAPGRQRAVRLARRRGAEAGARPEGVVKALNLTGAAAYRTAG